MPKPKCEPGWDTLRWAHMTLGTTEAGVLKLVLLGKVRAKIDMGTPIRVSREDVERIAAEKGLSVEDVERVAAEAAAGRSIKGVRGRKLAGTSSDAPVV